MQIIQQAFRVYTERKGFDELIKFYEGLQGCTCERRVQVPERDVEVAKVGQFLIFAGASEQLKAVREVTAIFYIDSLDEYATWLNEQGTEIVHPPQTVTGGRNLTARHADGLLVEYFEPVSK